MKLLFNATIARCLAGVLLAGTLVLGLSISAQETTGTVSGVVHDTTGAIIPHSTVVLKNLQNNSERKSTSNGTGNFSIASVSSGLQYQVTVTRDGFSGWQSQPFALRPGDLVDFKDIKLGVASASAEITVEAEASQAVKPLDTPERSDILTAKDLATLSIEGRDATELIRTLPGFSLVNPGLNNQAPNDSVVGVNSASTGNYSANGTGVTGIATILDGVSLVDIGSNSTTVQTMNSEMVQEVKVDSANFSADYAHGPVVINGVTKAGSASYHGEAYLYARNTALNANDWYNNSLQLPRPDGRFFYPGGTFGGPLWIPHTRFHRANAKLFFFAGYEYVNQLFSPETLGAFVPTMAQRNGDFSTASLNAQLCGARPDGRVNPNSILPMCNAENFLPSGASVSNGNLVGLGNPSGIALLNWLPLPNSDPFTNISGYNYVQEVLQHQNGSMFHTRVDYAINDSNKLWATYGRQAQVTQDPVAYGYAPSNSVLFPGDVSSGDISNILSLTYTHVFGSTVTNEFNAALSLISNPANEGNPAAAGRFTINGYNCNDPAKRAAGTCGSAGKGNFNYLGEFKNAGDYSVPALADYSSLGYPNVLMPGGFYNNQVHLKKAIPDVQDAVTWVKGRHTFTFGAYYEKGIINGLADFGTLPQGQYTFNPGTSGYDYNPNVGQAAQFQGCVNPDPSGNTRNSGAAYLGACINPNALMYLGYADTFTQTNFAPVVNMQYTTLAGFFNDSLKLKRLTFQLGLRFEHLGPWVDRHSNGLATFQPSLYTTQCSGSVCGSANDPGITWHGLDSSIANSVNSPATIYASPRLGLAWDIFGKGNTVIRGGWGIYRHQEEFSPYALAASTAQGYKTTFQTTGSLPLSFDQLDSQSPVNPQDFSVYTIARDDTDRPTYYEYNGALSQRLSWNRVRLRDSLLEVAYVGSNSQHLSTYNNQAGGYNEASDTNLIPAGFFFRTDGTADLSRLTDAKLTQPDSIGSLTQAQTDFYRPYPFYNHIYTLRHNFYANYNSVQVSWNKSSGLIQFGANYTFSKNLATAASYSNLVPDPLNLRNDYNPTPFDRTQVFNSHYLVDLGKRYHGDHRLLSETLNGWQISGISSVQSGPPLASIQGNFGFGYGSIQPLQVASQPQESRTAESTCEKTYNIPADSNGNHFCVTNVNPNVWLGTPDYQLMPTVTCNPTSGLASKQFIKPTCFGIPLPGGPVSGPNGQKLPNQTGQGQLRLPYMHGPAYQTHDLTLLKNFAVGERHLQLRLAAFNFLNHPLTSFNNNDQGNLNLGFQFATAGKPFAQQDLLHQNFGIAGIKYGSRRLELGAKFEF